MSDKGEELSKHDTENEEDQHTEQDEGSQEEGEEESQMQTDQEMPEDEEEEEEDQLINNHDLIGIEGIIRAQKNEIEKKKVSYNFSNRLI